MPRPVLISIDDKGKRDTFPIILVTFKLSPSLAVIEEKYISVPTLASIPARLNEIGVSIRMPILDPVEKPVIVTGIVAPIIVDIPNPNAPLVGRKVVVVGGELLLIEAVSVNGKGRIISTGKLGEVMKESVRAAESYVKSRSDDFGINSNFFTTKDIHVHVPEGATPKDGPSAGVAMCTSIVSVMTGIPVKRDVAMTGEITLRGRVLPIGGLKEKLIAANRLNIKVVLIPKDNEKDLAEIPKKMIKELKIIRVSNLDEVLKHSLTKKITPIDWSKIPVAEKKSTDNELLV